MLGSWVRAPSGSLKKRGPRDLFFCLRALTQGFFQSQAWRKSQNEFTVQEILLGHSISYGFKCISILLLSVPAAFRLFRCHSIKFHQSHSLLCSFFNLQKHIRKKNENHLDMFFRTPLYVISTEFICIFGVLLSMPLWRFVLCFQC